MWGHVFAYINAFMCVYVFVIVCWGKGGGRRERSNSLCGRNAYGERETRALKKRGSAFLVSYHIISYYIISYHIILCDIISYHIISYHIISYHIISYHIISYHIISYYSISYYIIIIIIIITIIISYRMRMYFKRKEYWSLQFASYTKYKIVNLSINVDRDKNKWTMILITVFIKKHCRSKANISQDLIKKWRKRTR